ncbi:hypothetical protein, partial [Bacillus subtilis]|uniref:hypothetical protein n=1 Tax=Bacillus subtilis TaxID=1423 RepID=UPI002DB8BB13
AHAFFKTLSCHFHHRTAFLGRCPDLVQMNFNVHQGEKVVLSDGEIDCLMRGLGDALRHMQKDLPEGVYRYIKINIEDALEHAIKQQKKRI